MDVYPDMSKEYSYVYKRNGYDVRCSKPLTDSHLEQFPKNVSSLLVPYFSYYIYDKFKNTNTGLGDEYLYSKCMEGHVLCYGTALVHLNGKRVQYYVVCESHRYTFGHAEYLSLTPVYMRDMPVKMYYPRNISIWVDCSSMHICRFCRGGTFAFRDSPNNFFCSLPNCAGNIITITKNLFSPEETQLELSDIVKDYAPPTEVRIACHKCMACKTCRKAKHGVCGRHKTCPHGSTNCKKKNVNFGHLKSQLSL